MPAVATMALACGSSSEPSDKRAGTQLAESIVQAAKKTSEMTAPHRCARIDPEATPPEIPGHLGKWKATWQDGVLELVDDKGKRRKRPLVVGVVGDARDSSASTLALAANVRARFAKKKADIVISLGGMGTNQASIRAVLAELVTDATWPVIAIPGDRESVSEHRAAIESLRGEGMAILDGSRVRAIVARGIAIGTMPGVEFGARLVGGDEGCIHTEADAADLAELLGSRKEVRVWAGYAPPRQSGPGASDRTSTGIHVGEEILVEALRSSGAKVVLHAAVDDPDPGSDSGGQQLSAPLVGLASGALEAMPAAGRHDLSGAALLLTIGSGKVQWQRIMYRPDGAAR